MVVTGVGFGSGQEKKGRIQAILLACTLFAGLAFLVACGGGSNVSNGGGNPGTPAGTYTISVTGTGTDVTGLRTQITVTPMLTIH